MNDRHRFGRLWAPFAGALLLVTGCSQPVGEPGQAKEGPSKAEALVAGTDHHDHSGWWCPEHGVPEEQCSMCSDKAAADFKKKGDWCEKHDRADSQCFVCHPELVAKFAALYEAKYGKSPPPREE